MPRCTERVFNYSNVECIDTPTYKIKHYNGEDKNKTRLTRKSCKKPVKKYLE